MRVIGISKRWRGQRGTQPHPENPIGESLEAQHSKGESLLNYIHILHIPLSFSSLLASFFISKAVLRQPRKQLKHLPFKHHFFATLPPSLLTDLFPPFLDFFFYTPPFIFLCFIDFIFFSSSLIVIFNCKPLALGWKDHFGYL